jgi:hypothetical protein
MILKSDQSTFGPDGLKMNMKNKEYLLHIDLSIAYVHYLYTLYIQYYFFTYIYTLN